MNRSSDISFTRHFKLLIISLLSILLMTFAAQDVFAATKLLVDTPVYYANSKIYHLKGECGTLSTSTSMALKEALQKGMVMCENCAADIGLSPEEAANITVSDLPMSVSGAVGSSGSVSGKTKSKNSNDDELLTDDEELTSSSQSSKSSQSKSSASGSVTTASSKSSAVSSSPSSSSSNGKTLMTESQRKRRFLSKTNPKRGAKPTTIPRAASAGFEYADFAKYNSYASENGLGMTPVYLLGTIMEIEKVSDKGSSYGAVMMVNDCDGYQWYMRLDVAKDKYDLMKAEFLGKAANIYGLYTGYSGVTNRPMMDPTVIIEIGGNAIDLAIYK